MGSTINPIKWVDDNTAVFLNSEVEFYHVFEFIMQQMKSADYVIISSFAITDYNVRRLMQARSSISHLTLFLDFTIASRRPAVTDFASDNVDELYLIKNHSKTIFAKNETDCMMAILSNNATSNHRWECGVIFRNNPAIDLLCMEYTKMKEGAVQWMNS